MNLEHALQVFLDESRELLTDMERLLLEMEEDSHGVEHRNALFRCVHTIKGSAGMFGLDHVVSFTHVVENVLDRLRNEEVTFSRELAQLLLRCRDQMSVLIELTEPANDPAINANEQQLLRLLARYQRAGENTLESLMTPTDTWHISVRFHDEVLKHGMDPLGFIRYLGRLGELVSVTPVADAMPPLKDLDPECCYLGFEIDLRAQTDKAAIEDVFEFVRDLCRLRILPPHSGVEAYMQLINELPEETERLGEILTASGALTAVELEEGLRLQSARDEKPRKPIGEVLVEEGLVQAELVSAALDKQQLGRERRKTSSQHLRVQADKLDRLINLVGEMVIASASVALKAAQGGDSATREAAAAMSLLVEEVRDSSLQLRMVPIGDTFQRFQRVVRDMSTDLEKDIELVISGADTELDKSVVEKIADPLTHLVRNACDHGIEPSATRQASGKRARGKLSLNAYHESGAIIIEVSDDGAGLNRERILAKAVERGLIQNDLSLTDRDVFNLIFEPGFSTAEKITNISGRGVGMDVVRRNIEALRGTVDVDSAPGAGTRFRIRLPLTLAIIDGFLSSIGDSTYVVPLEMVEECVEYSSFSCESAAEAGRSVGGERDLLNLRGEVLPLIPLREHFGVATPKPRRQNVLVVNHGGAKAGLVVDELLGEHQTVIKPLSEIFSHIEGLSGSTILGSGKVALILDVPGLIQLALRHEELSVNRRNTLNSGLRQPVH